MRARPRAIAILVLAGVLVLGIGTLQPAYAPPKAGDKPQAGAKQPATVQYGKLLPNVQYGQLPPTNPRPVTTGAPATSHAPVSGTVENREGVSQTNRRDEAARGQREKPLEMGTASKHMHKLPPSRIETDIASKQKQKQRHMQKLPPTRIDPKPIDNGPERMAPRRSRKGQPGAAAGPWPDPTTSNPLRQRTTSTAATPSSRTASTAATPPRSTSSAAATPSRKTSSPGTITAQQPSDSANASTSRRAAPAEAGAATAGQSAAARPAQIVKGPSVAERRAQFEPQSKPAATMQAKGQRTSSTTPPANPTEPAASPKARKRKGGP